MKQTINGLRLSASDLVGFLNCEYLTQLELQVSRGERTKHFNADPMLEVLRERGFRHEEEYLEQLERNGRTLTRIADGDICQDTVAQTRNAMSAGADVIVQAALQHDCWAGKADVLLRVDRPSSLGVWSYEVLDTKLARQTKAGTILQLSLYSDLIARIQGIEPERMHVVMPWTDYEPESWRVADFGAFFRKVRAELERTIKTGAGPVLYPKPVAHCDVCDWRQVCEAKRREDDHLSLAAGISGLQMRELESRGVSTLAGLAGLALPLEPRPERGSPESYSRVREQARVQFEGREEGKLKYELLPLAEGQGLCRLPAPSDADVFLDFEGDPFVGEHGLEYLFGYYFRGDNGGWEYRGAWALDRASEKAAFEEFIDFVTARRAADPGLHVYHYGGYESGALKRLMGRYATREEELDNLLRGEVLVDLLAVVRHALRASVESYSVKRLEPFYGYERDAALPDANLALRRLETSLELGDGDPQAEDLVTVEAYNRDDCVSTRELRNWLEELRDQLVQAGTEVPRPLPPAVAEAEVLSDHAAKVAELVQRLTADVPVDVNERTPEQQGRWLLAHLLEWHRREAKAVWWEFFRLRDLTAEELLDERCGLAGLEFVDLVGGTQRCPVHRYRFPIQEVDIRAGKTLYQEGGDKLGSVVELSLEDRTINIKKRQDTAGVHPTSLFMHDRVSTRPIEDALLRLGEYVADHGIEGSGPHGAARDLLLRQAPKVAGQRFECLQGEAPLEAALRVVGELDPGTLPIQGPPGTGKTFTGSRMICELVRAGKKVGVVANSHAVVRNLLEAVVREAKKQDLDLRCVHKADENHDACEGISIAANAAAVLNSLDSDCPIAGGTAWLWSHAHMCGSVDVLFVDEAAQMSLANVVAVAQAATSVVLLGDPQQLDQPMQGSHPDGTDTSALDHLLSGKQTIEEGEGLFLAETWRLHPDICALTSELFYESKLVSRPELKNQAIAFDGLPSSGLIYLPVAHDGNQNSSPEEARTIAALVSEVLSSGATWTDCEGVVRPLTLRDILIITPYNAQVQTIKQLLPGARVGTVDKFQGQEAPIAIYSLATSSHADAPRGMEFLYSLNRLNVATSRARCVSIMVASPAIFDPDCATPRQLKLANAFCRFLELSGQRWEVAAPVLVH